AAWGGHPRPTGSDGAADLAEDGHPRVELRQRRVARRALRRAVVGSGEETRQHQHRGRARLRSCHRIQGNAALPQLRRADRVHARQVHRMRRLRRHLPDRLHLFHRQCRRTGVAQAPDCSGAEHHPGPVRVRAAEDDAGDGQGRGCVPALQSVCRTLPDRRLGHAEVPAAGDVRRPGMPQPYGKGTGMNAPAVQSGLLPALVAVNDFVVKFANVNGSGSASANELFAKAILRMGVPVSPRNIFPSNIQGLRTWYEVRVTEAGHLGRRGGVDLMVAMNPQTWDRDVAEIEPGGYLLYDCTRPVLPSKLRGDVNAVGVPLSEICGHAFPEPRQRQLFKNIVYVGVLAALLGIELVEAEELI